MNTLHKGAKNDDNNNYYKCRFFQTFDEAIGEIILARRILAKEQHLNAHDTVCVLNYPLTYARK
jgi:hypothetical protein